MGCLYLQTATHTHTHTHTGTVQCSIKAVQDSYHGGTVHYSTVCTDIAFLTETRVRSTCKDTASFSFGVRLTCLCLCLCLLWSCPWCTSTAAARGGTREPKRCNLNRHDCTDTSKSLSWQFKRPARCTYVRKC